MIVDHKDKQENKYQKEEGDVTFEVLPSTIDCGNDEIGTCTPSGPCFTHDSDASYLPT